MFLDAMNTNLGASFGSGALGAALGKNRQEQAMEKAEAIANGRKTGQGGDVDAKLRGVAEEFVSVFMNQVMKSMRSTVNQNPAMHGDNGEKFFQEMLDTEQSKTLAAGSGYGLTDLIYQSLVQKVRVEDSPAAAGQKTESANEALVEESEAVATVNL